MRERISIAAAVLIVLALTAMAARADVRTIDGTGNNLANPTWGAAEQQLLRIGPMNYGGDGSGHDMLSDLDRANARTVSNLVAAQTTTAANPHAMSNFVWQWGQFLDHDIDLTESDASNGSTMILAGHTDPLWPGVPMNRSNYDHATGTVDAPRQQVNHITAYIDASNVYGSDAATAAALRTDGGLGAYLRTSANNLLPIDPMTGMFMAGDVRANEQVGLTAMHTVFMREHNRLVDALLAHNPSLTDEQAYQTARKIVGAQMQIITYNEFLPAVLGTHAPAAGAYLYDDAVNAGIANEFSTALFRFGHTMLSPTFELLDADGNATGSLGLRDAFFNPSLLQNDPGMLTPLLRGLATNPAQQIDNQIIDDVRNFLFGAPGAGGMDLASLNIQRGRDHGLPDYNTLRAAYGLAPVASFADITSNLDLQLALAALYGDVNNIDAWVGALAEDHLPGAAVGELIAAGLIDQFTRLRDGDRFFFLGDEELFTGDIAAVIDLNTVSLGKILAANTEFNWNGASVFATVPAPATGAALAAALAFGLVRRRRR